MLDQVSLQLQRRGQHQRTQTTPMPVQTVNKMGGYVLLNFLLVVEANLQTRRRIQQLRNIPSRAFSVVETKAQIPYLTLNTLVIFPMRCRHMNFDRGAIIEFHVTLRTTERRRFTMSLVTFFTYAGDQFRPLEHLETESARNQVRWLVEMEFCVNSGLHLRNQSLATYNAYRGQD